MKKIRDRRDYMKKWHATHKEHEKKYRLINKVHILKVCKQYKQKNKNIIKIKNKNYKLKNKQKIHEYYLLNKKYIRNKTKKYYILHKDKLKYIHRKYMKNKYNTDIIFRLAANMRTRINRVLKDQHVNKDEKTLFLLGCSPKKLKTHLEKQFKPGMSWDNYNKFGWHVDHIKPLCSFNLLCLDKRKKACHYKNLQPLWAEENLSKGGKS